MLIEIDERERDTILAALRYWQDANVNHWLINAELVEIAENGRSGDGSSLKDAEIDDLCEMINCPEDTNAIAWRALDAAGITLLVGLDIDGIQEQRRDEGLPDAPREVVLEAMRKVAEGDWSEASHEASTACHIEIAKLMEETGAA